MKDFKKLIVWQKGLENFIAIHVFARKLPPEEKYELASQIRRAAFQFLLTLQKEVQKLQIPL